MNKNTAPGTPKDLSTRALKILFALGIQIEWQARRDFRVRFRRRFLYLVGGCALFVFLFLLGAARYSESPRFCRSCHIMEPYYKAWHGSKHKGVACVECHYPPASPKTILWKKFQALSQVVKYVTRTYSSKPFAEVEDSACLQCHSTRLLEGKLVTSRGVRFDHRAHLTTLRRGRHLACTSCHAQMVVGNHMEVSWDTCYLCHFKGMGQGQDLKPIGGCTGCHELPKKDFKIDNMLYNHRDFVTKQGVPCQSCHVEAVQGSGEASQDRCFTCHNQPEKLSRIKDIPFLHENHVTKHNVACFHCHQEIRHTLLLGGDSRLAGLEKPPVPAPSAHGAALTFECAYCHENKHFGQREMYSGRVASLGLPELPSPMFLAQVDCVGCHTKEEPDADKEFRGRTMTALTQACVNCHGPKFNGIMEETKGELKAALSALDQKRAVLAAALGKSGLPEADQGPLRAQMARAARWQDFVRVSRGSHNIYLASLALRRQDRLLDEVGEKLNTVLPDMSGQPLLTGGYCATMCHGRLGVKVPPETVRHAGKTMPHKMHAEMMGCVQCHEIGGHKKVPLRKDVEAVCGGCHTP